MWSFGWVRWQGTDRGRRRPFLSMIGLIWCGREVTGALIVKEIQEHEPKSVLGAEKTPCNSQTTSPTLSITDGDRPESWGSNVTSSRRSGRYSQRRRKEVCWSVWRRASSCGRGTFGLVGGGSAGGGPSSATETLSWRAWTFGMGLGGGGSKEQWPSEDRGTWTSGEEEVSRRSRGSRSVDPNSGMV